MRFIKIFIESIFMISLVFSSTTMGQNIENIKNEKPFNYSGGLSTSNNYNYTSNQENKNPYSYFINGNFNAAFYGISFPLSFSYTNKNVNYSKPFNFNQFGAQPYYRWIKAYLGFNSMSFSPYTYNGHQFLGTGIELSPTDLPIRFSAFYGRLIKGVDLDTSQMDVRPYYKRLGYGTKISYSAGGDLVEIVLFKAWDQLNSIRILPDSLGVFPMQNSVLGFAFSKNLFQKLKISANYGYSLITQDTRNNSPEINEKKSFGWLIKLNSTSDRSSAYKAGIDYTGNFYTLGVNYERIDPDYVTLGSYYSQNDLETYAATFSTRILEGKITLNGNLGTQKDNLDRSKTSTSNQLVSSFSIAFVPGQKIQFNTSYSNFRNFTRIRMPFDQINNTNPYQDLDSLNFTQISENASLGINYSIVSSKEKRWTAGMNASFQKSSSKQQLNPGYSDAVFYMGNLFSNYYLTKLGMGANLSFLLSFNEIPQSGNSITFGPVLGITKEFLSKKLNTGLSFSYNQTQNEKNVKGEILSARVTASYSVNKKHQFSLNASQMIRWSDKTNYSFGGTFSYNFKFQSK